MPQLVGPVSPITVAVKPELWKKLRKVGGYMEEYVKDYKSPEATGFFLAYVTRNPGGEGFHFLAIDGKTVVYKSYGGEGRKYFGQVLQREFNKYFNARHNPDNSYAVISESPRFASSGMSYAEAKEMADSMGGEVVTVEVARAYKQQMLSEKQGSSFYGTGRSGEFRNVRGRWNPAADPIGRYEALRRMADPSGNASANERQMAELLMAKIEAKLGYVPAAPVTKPTRSTGRKGAAKAIAARRHLENSRRHNPLESAGGQPAGGGWVVVEHDANFYSPVMTRAAADALAVRRRSQIGPKWRPRSAQDDEYWEEEATKMRASAEIEVLPAAEGLWRQLNQLMVPGGYVDDLKLVDPAALLAVTHALSRALDDQMRASRIWHEGPDYFGARIRRPASSSRGFGDEVECIFRVASPAYNELMEQWTHAVQVAVAPYANNIQKIEFEQYENVDRGTTQVRTRIIMKD